MSLKQNFKLAKRVTLSLNRNTIFESSKIKYLGVIMDSRLTWKHHIFELGKKLNRAVGMLYKLRQIRCNKQILLSIYHSLFQSHLMYGLCVWGNTANSYLEKLYLTQKRAIRSIAGLDFGEPTGNAFRELKILKLRDLFKSQYAGLMWDQDHDLLPSCFNAFFHKISNVHNYETRSSAAQKLSENVKINTKTHGESMLKYQGPKILNYLKDQDFYLSSRTKKTFQAKHKSFLISFY